MCWLWFLFSGEAATIEQIALILQTSGHWDEATLLLRRHHDLVLGLVLGVEIGAIVHLLTDGFYDGVVRPLRKLGKKTGASRS